MPQIYVLKMYLKIVYKMSPINSIVYPVKRDLTKRTTHANDKSNKRKTRTAVQQELEVR